MKLDISNNEMVYRNLDGIESVITESVISIKALIPISFVAAI